MKTKQLSQERQTAIEFIGVFYDQYEDMDESDVMAMTNEQALKFVIEHITFMIEINGEDELWSSEMEAIERFDLYDKLNLDQDYIRQLYFNKYGVKLV